MAHALFDNAHVIMRSEQLPFAVWTPGTSPMWTSSSGIIKLEILQALEVASPPTVPALESCNSYPSSTRFGCPRCPKRASGP